MGRINTQIWITGKEEYDRNTDTDVEDVNPAAVWSIDQIKFWGSDYGELGGCGTEGIDYGANPTVDYSTYPEPLIEENEDFTLDVDVIVTVGGSPTGWNDFHGAGLNLGDGAQGDGEVVTLGLLSADYSPGDGQSIFSVGKKWGYYTGWDRVDVHIGTGSFHLKIVRESGTISVYKDGVLKGTYTTNAAVYGILTVPDCGLWDYEFYLRDVRLKRGV